MEGVEICPSCGNNMEHGYIISNYTIRWCNHVPRAICWCGEKLSKGFWTCVRVEGYRCKSCQIIRYTKE
ncbi:MAG: PF20097 family protein [Candidatus Thorarchaeota archaeon]|jgi:hypothetical protein